MWLFVFASAVPLSLQLNGVAQYAAAPAAVYFTSSGFTVEGWVYQTYVNSWARLMDFGNGPSSKLINDHLHTFLHINSQATMSASPLHNVNQ